MYILFYWIYKNSWFAKHILISCFHKEVESTYQTNNISINSNNQLNTNNIYLDVKNQFHLMKNGIFQISII